MHTDPTTGRPAPVPATHRSAALVAGPATVTVAQRRAADIGSDDAIAIPDEVFVPVPARIGGRRTWVWRSKPSWQLPNAHRWRWVYDVDELDDDAGDAGYAASLPLGLRLLRVSDDHPDQGQQYRTLVIAVREYELIDIQIRAAHGQQQPSEHDANATGRGSEPHGLDAKTRGFADFTARDAQVRVFDRSTDAGSTAAGSDDASDMYVLEVFGVSVLVRLRATLTDPTGRRQLYMHIDNEDRAPTDVAVEVANGGETHYHL
jgi:hypothetical protein